MPQHTRFTVGFSNAAYLQRYNYAVCTTKGSGGTKVDRGGWGWCGFGVGWEGGSVGCLCLESCLLVPCFADVNPSVNVALTATGSLGIFNRIIRLGKSRM